MRELAGPLYTYFFLKKGPLHSDKIQTAGVQGLGLYLSKSVSLNPIYLRQLGFRVSGSIYLQYTDST